MFQGNRHENEERLAAKWYRLSLFSQLKIANQAKAIMIKELSSIQGTMVHSQSERRIIYNLIHMNQRDRVTSNRHLVSISGYMICSFVPLGTKLSTLIGCVQ